MQTETCYAYTSSSLVGSSSSGSGGKGYKQTTSLVSWWNHAWYANEAKKGSWYIPLSKVTSSTLSCAHAAFLASLSSRTCLASGCSAALRSWVRWRSVASLVCLAAGCTTALRTRHLSNLPCLTSVCSDLRSSSGFFCAWRWTLKFEDVCKIISVRSI